MSLASGLEPGVLDVQLTRQNMLNSSAICFTEITEGRELLLVRSVALLSTSTNVRVLLEGVMVRHWVDRCLKVFMFTSLLVAIETPVLLVRRA